MNKKQQQELQEAARHFNGTMCRWDRNKNPETKNELEGAMRALSDKLDEIINK